MTVIITMIPLYTSKILRLRIGTKTVVFSATSHYRMVELIKKHVDMSNSSRRFKHIDMSKLQRKKEGEVSPNHTNSDFPCCSRRHVEITTHVFWH